MVPIRAAQPSDAAGIARVQTHAWQRAYRGLLSDALLDSLDEAETATRWAEGISALDRRVDEVLVSLDRDQVTGFARVGASRDDDADDATGELWALYVLPSLVGFGIGSDLLDAGVEWLTSAGFRSQRLWTLEGNLAAQRFYAARGWVLDGARRERDIGERSVEIRMARTPP